MIEKFKCCLCGDIDEFDLDNEDSKVDADYYRGFKNHMCIKCYAKVCEIVKEGQCDITVMHRASEIKKKGMRE